MFSSLPSKTTCMLGVIFAAACGGAQPPAAGPEGSNDPKNGSEQGTPDTTPPANGMYTGEHGPGVTAKPVANSTMLAELQNLGLDVKTMPSLAKLDPKTQRKVMGTFTKALGVKCTHCHDESHFEAMTPMKKITLRMWDDFVRGMAFEDGSAVYCDSCHQGSAKVLDRSDKRALGAWMEENFVVKMKRRDGQEHGCATCHGDPFEGDFLEDWAKEAAHPSVR